MCFIFCALQTVSRDRWADRRGGGYLNVIVGIPVRIEDNDGVCSGQVDPQATGPGGQEEAELTGTRSCSRDREKTAREEREGERKVGECKEKERGKNDEGGASGNREEREGERTKCEGIKGTEKKKWERKGERKKREE